MQLQVNKGHIVQAVVYSDALEAELFAALGPALKGSRYEAQAISQILLKLAADGSGQAEHLAELAAYVQENI